MAGKKGVSGGARRGAGRRAGIPNKATIERELLAARVLAEQAGRQPDRKLAREVLDDLMHVALGLTGYFQPIPKGAPTPADREPDHDRFQTYFNMAKDCAKELAAYQSPKFKAVVNLGEGRPGGVLPGAPEGAVPSSPGLAGALSPQDAYRLLRDSDTIDLSGGSVVEVPAKKRGAA